MTIRFLVKGDFSTKTVDHHYRPATFRTSLYVRIRDGKEIDQMRLSPSCANYMTASSLDKLYDYILSENDRVREHPELLLQDEGTPALRPRSRMARRTFINTLYRKVKDPSLIASLTGHSDGSRAFQRYRAIDDKIKEELVRMLEV